MDEFEFPDDWRTWDEDLKRELMYRLTYDWSLHARPDQLSPPGNWLVWLLLAGRGAGKTRSGAEYCRTFANENPGCRVGVIAPTYGQVRDVALEGESGLLAVIPPEEVERYNKSLGQLTMENGSRFFSYSGNDPEKLRGPQHHLLWCEELTSWPYVQATWDMAQFGLRLGDRPRTVITTTPRPIPLLKHLVLRNEAEPEEVAITRASTFDNAANLPESQLKMLKAQYAGTHLGMQELMGLLIDDIEGALWHRDQLEEDRVPQAMVPTLDRIVVGVDPAGSDKPHSAETGIVVVGRGIDGHGYVLADGTLRASPDIWGKAVINLYNMSHADAIVVERNFGGDMCRHVIHTQDPLAHVKEVNASRGKFIRAEPVAALYEQHRMHHVGVLPKLEDSLCTWVPNPADGKPLPSPDRMDALVWACFDVMLKGGPAEIMTPDISRWQIPTM